jgi:hypothetical protein
MRLLLLTRQRVQGVQRDCAFLQALMSASDEDRRLFLARQTDSIVDTSLRDVLCRTEASTCGSILRRLAKAEDLRHLSPLQHQEAWDSFLARGYASVPLVAFVDEASRIAIAHSALTKKAMSTGSYSEYSDYSESHHDDSSSGSEDASN